MIKEIFDLKRNGHTSSGKFSISSINGCMRKKYMEMKNLYKEEYNENTIRTFKIGDAFHRLAVQEIMEKGEQLGLHVVSAEVNIPDTHIDAKYISGRSDLIISDVKTGELMIVDCKSAGDYTMRKIQDGNIPENYINQVQLYLHFFGMKRGYLLFYGKHKGLIEEYEILHDENKCKKLISEIEDFMVNYVEKDIPPPKCTPEISPFGCEVCFPKGENKNA